MPNHKPESKFVSDQASLNKPRAESKGERRLALEFCLTQRWANVDIGRVERIENRTRCGWLLRPYTSDR